MSYEQMFSQLEEMTVISISQYLTKCNQTKIRYTYICMYDTGAYNTCILYFTFSSSFVMINEIPLECNSNPQKWNLAFKDSQIQTHFVLSIKLFKL